ncbi:MAG: lipoprotein-releasing system permease protein [Candidatus Azotimanducaceae bacterium]
MKHELFIAKRIGATTSKEHSVTKPIINIAVGAIAISLIVIIIAMATGMGLQKTIRDKVAHFGGHIRITNFDFNNAAEQSPISGNQEFYQVLKDKPKIDHVQKVATKAGLIKTETDFEGVIFKGISSDFNPKFFKEYLRQGTVPSFYPGMRNDSIVVSSLLAKRLQLSIGHKVAMYFFNKGNGKPKIRAFIVSGIYNTGLEDFDKNMVFGALEQIRGINKWEASQIGAFEIQLHNFSDLEKMDEWIYQIIGFNLSTQTVAELHPQLLQWVQLFDTNIILIIAIMIAVGIINITSALLIMILERTQMIGILKALGSNNWSIRKIFILKASQLIFKGLLIGNVIGLGFCLLQQNFGWIELDETSYYVRQVPIYLDWSLIILVNVGTLLIAFFTMLFPSWLITKIKPIKAIRFD